MQRAHHAVDVNPSDRGYPTARDGLAVGNDGQGLQRGLGEPRGGPADDEALDEVVKLRG